LTLAKALEGKNVQDLILNIGAAGLVAAAKCSFAY